MSKVLIVDDSPVMRKIVIRAIRQAGYGDLEIAEADDGTTALEAIRASRPDAVLSDWNMPTMNGIDLLKALRAEEIDVPFGFVTSESEAQQRTDAHQAGAAFMLSKPFTSEDLSEALEQVL